MTIVVLSCDKNEDLFQPFYHCMEKYWKNHPKVVYFTETIDNPYYETVKVDYPLNIWTKRIRESLKQVDDNHILIMMDDCFIHSDVNKSRLEYCESIIEEANFINFEKSFDSDDRICQYEGLLVRPTDGLCKISIMCGLWDKHKLLKCLSVDCSPWEVESTYQHLADFDTYINNKDDFIIDWGHEPWQWFGVVQGKWCSDVVDFFNREGIYVDYTKRGFCR